MDVHVLCPFWRKELYKTIIHYYTPMNIILHPLCYPADYGPFEGNTIPWVKPYLCDKFTDWCIPYQKINNFIDNNLDQIVDTDYYGFNGDDSMYEPGLTDEVKKQTTDVVVVSGYRGDKIPVGDGVCPHATTPLMMRTLHDIKLNQIGFGMFFVNGKILKQTRFGVKWGGDDGLYAEKVKTMGSVAILTNWYVFCNYFQPGRYTSTRPFRKPTWELPKFL